MTEPSWDEWDAAIARVLSNASEGHWDVAREEALALEATLDGDLANEWRLSIDSPMAVRLATSALTSNALDAAAVLLFLLPGFAEVSMCVGAVASGDLELVVAICPAVGSLIDDDEKNLWRVIVDLAVDALFASELPDAALLALHVMASADEDPTSEASRRSRAERAASHGARHPARREYELVRRALVTMCARRRDGEKGPIFDRCAGAVGTSVIDQPAVFEASARAARACLERGSRSGAHFQTAIAAALLGGREDEATRLKTAMETGARPSHVAAVWRRAIEAVAELRERRGPASTLGVARRILR